MRPASPNGGRGKKGTGSTRVPKQFETEFKEHVGGRSGGGGDSAAPGRRKRKAVAQQQASSRSLEIRTGEKRKRGQLASMSSASLRGGEGRVVQDRPTIERGDSCPRGPRARGGKKPNAEKEWRLALRGKRIEASATAAHLVATFAREKRGKWVFRRRPQGGKKILHARYRPAKRRGKKRGKVVAFHSGKQRKKTQRPLENDTCPFFGIH